MHPLAVALRLQRRFVSDASHELRTPLTLLTTRAQLLRRHVQRGANRKAVLADIDSLVADGDNLTAVLEDLLLAADPRSGSGCEHIDVGLLVSSVVTTSVAAARASSVNLSMLDAEPAYVGGNPVALRRAVTALTDNAVRHAHKAVTLTVGLRDRHAVIEVADDGAGIDPEVAPRLFERFTSSGPSTAEGPRRRYGLGLALVGEIVAQHGGRIEVCGTDVGATFRITLPAAAAPRSLPSNLSN
ncbi:sensor histidine kinase [Actinopolymorpha pittospori]|uniref:sensor histidine kinase n=1 Tax=Actinopolymorpha pittospori TaxID=648752 RepID=UPI003B5899D6